MGKTEGLATGWVRIDGSNVVKEELSSVVLCSIPYRMAVLTDSSDSLKASTMSVCMAMFTDMAEDRRHNIELSLLDNRTESSVSVVLTRTWLKQ
jgi:hypothetical protein